MRYLILVSILLMHLSLASAQDTLYFTRTGHIYFISATDIIDIDANNRQVGSFLNIRTGEMVFTLLMKSFEFTLPMAEEHFNENYVESEKYPKSTFQGQILQVDEIDLTKPGKYTVDVAGDLSIHGVKKPVQVQGELEVQDGVIRAEAEFSILLKDYKIKVPRIVDDKVAKTIPIRVKMVYKPYRRSL